MRFSVQLASCGLVPYATMVQGQAPFEASKSFFLKKEAKTFAG
jgi:hypothetical protein